MGRIRKNYYSLDFSDVCDPNSSKDIESGIFINEHDNCIGLDDLMIEENLNYFKTKTEAKRAKKKIVDLLTDNL